MADLEKVSGLAAQVYDRLRAAIIDCRYPAGERLRERELGEELHVSRVPIREALPRLEAAGFVRMEPRRGAVVTFITDKDVEELYDLRSVVEPLVARTAARRVAQGESAATLAGALDAASGALATSDLDGLHAANALIHREIVRIAGNDLLNKTLAPLNERSDRLNAVTISTDRGERHYEHKMLVESIVAGNIEVAGSVAFSHVELGRRRTLSTLPDHPHYAAPVPVPSRRRSS
jgi:DNA-binding GntR family transcriptional regulator